MSSIKVVDLNEEGKEPPVAQRASAGQQGCPPVIGETNEAEEEQVPEITNEAEEDPIEEEPGIDTPKEEEKPKPKPKPKASQLVRCPKCNREMTYKNLRYSHNCSTEPKPVKPQANPKGKAKPKPTPKPPPEIYYSDEEEEDEVPQQPLIRKKQPPQPINPTTALAQHYQLLQQAFIKQKQERYNNLCMNMFSSKTKKR